MLFKPLRCSVIIYRDIYTRNIEHLKPYKHNKFFSMMKMLTQYHMTGQKQISFIISSLMITYKVPQEVVL